MTLQDPIIACLPATEDEIVGRFPRSDPDAILRMIWSRALTGRIKRYRDKKYYAYTPPEDIDILTKPRSKKKKLPTFIACRECGKEKARRFDFPRGSDRCFKCQPRSARKAAARKRSKRVGL